MNLPNLENLQKVNGNIFVETFFDQSFAYYCRHAGLTESVKISRLKESSGKVVQEFTHHIDGEVYFDINGLQTRFKNTLEPYLNKLFLDQLTAFHIDKDSHIFVDVSPVLKDRLERQVVYVTFHAQPNDVVRPEQNPRLHMIRVH